MHRNESNNQSDPVFVVEVCQPTKDHQWNTRLDGAKYLEYFNRGRSLSDSLVCLGRVMAVSSAFWQLQFPPFLKFVTLLAFDVGLTTGLDLMIALLSYSVSVIVANACLSVYV